MMKSPKVAPAISSTCQVTGYVAVPKISLATSTPISTKSSPEKTNDQYTALRVTSRKCSQPVAKTVRHQPAVVALERMVGIATTPLSPSSTCAARPRCSSTVVRKRLTVNARSPAASADQSSRLARKSPVIGTRFVLRSTGVQ